MPDSRLFNIVNGYPIFPVAIISTNILAFLPVISLLYIAQRAPLHSNCRYILCVWTLSFGAVYMLNVIIAILDLTNPTGYMPLDMFDPPIRFIIYECHVMCTTFCSTFEIALSIERIVAIIHPRRYHFSDIASKSLCILTVSLIAFSYVVDSFVHGDTDVSRYIGCVLLAVVELLVLATGGASAKACRVRYKKMFGKASLTARYQVNEAYEMSRAMIPAYAVSFLLKVSTILTIWFFFEVREEYGYILGYLEASYFMTNAINGSFSLTILLLKHPQLRKHTLRKFRALFGIKPPHKKNDNTAKPTSEMYFTVLAVYWNRSSATDDNHISIR